MVEVTPYSAANLIAEAKVDPIQWNSMPSELVIARTAAALEGHGIRVIRTPGAAGAAEILKAIIPPGSEVMNGSSITLTEIGYEDLIRSRTLGWRDLHAVITAENDAGKRADLRRKSVTAEYFLSGVNAISRTGELVGCDLTGSRTGAWLYAAKNLILVSGVNKIVPTLNDALQRIHEYVYPLENVHARKLYNMSSAIGKCAIIAEEKTPGRTTLVLVNESLGY